MSFEKHNRSVSLLCSTCGGTQFERDDEMENSPIRCNGCSRVFSKDELIQENDEVIQAEIGQMKSDIVADITAQFKKQFKNSKFIKVK